MLKWEEIYKLKNTKILEDSNVLMFLHGDCDWICTDFGHSIGSKKIDRFVMKPLQQHPYGKEFGSAPSVLEVMIINKEELEENFELQLGRNFMEEQREYDRKVNWEDFKNDEEDKDY